MTEQQTEQDEQRQNATAPAAVPFRVLCDGMITEPRLAHPEGVAVDADGFIWCGGELGQIYRVAPDGSSREVVASTGGFCLGIAFGPTGDLFVCDLKHAAVFRLDPRTRQLDLFATGVPGHRFRVPNFPAFDADGRLYVSDSWEMGIPGPGIVRLRPDGSGELWHAGPFNFANGLALNHDCTRLYVVETFRNAIAAIDIESDGTAGAKTDLALLPGVLPDGLAVGQDGSVYVGCYEPSQVLRVDPAGTVHTVAADPTAHILAHPTNVAFLDDALITANLGRWHLSRVEVAARGLALPPRRNP